jgi:hypothetical protein
MVKFAASREACLPDSFATCRATNLKDAEFMGAGPPFSLPLTGLPFFAERPLKLNPGECKVVSH